MHVATTETLSSHCYYGQLATSVAVDHFGITPPKVGHFTNFTFEGRLMRLYRMPSSSRAYPMRVESKAEIYKSCLVDEFLSF